MRALRLFQPVLGSLGLLGYVLIGLLLAALAFLLLRWAYNSALASLGGRNAPPPPPPPPPYTATIEQLQGLLQKIKDAGSASGDDCAELRRLLQKAKDEGAPSDITDQLKKLIDAVC